MFGPTLTSVKVLKLAQPSTTLDSAARPHTARGRGSGDDERVHPGGGEEAGEARAEETGGEELVENGFRLSGSYARVDLRPARSRLQGEERRNLIYKGGRRKLVRLTVGHGGEDNWHLHLSGGFQELLYLGHRTFKVAGEGRFRIGEPQGHVYDDEGGAPAEAAAPAEAFDVSQGTILRWRGPCRVRRRATR